MMIYQRYVLDKYAKREKSSKIIDSVRLKYMSNGEVVDLLNKLANDNLEQEIAIKLYDDDVSRLIEENKNLKEENMKLKELINND